MKNTTTIILILISIVFFQGCSSKTMTSTLFDINSEEDTDGYLWNIKQTRMTTVNPLSSFEEVGQVCLLYPNRGAETAIYLDINASANKIVKSYENNATKNNLMGIRDDLLRLDRQTVALVSKNIELLNYKLYDQSDNNTSLKAHQKTDLVNKMANLEHNITALTNDLNVTYSNLIRDLNQSNAIIIRWSKEKEKSFIGKIGEIFNIDTTSKKSLSGFLLASGLKEERLILNKKFVKNLDTNINDSVTVTTGVITYTLSAKDLIFVNKSDISTIFGVDLDVAYDDFVGNSTDILEKINELKIHIAASKVENGLSGGYLSEPTITKERIVLDSCEVGNCSNKLQKSSEDSVFFAVYTELENLKKIFK